MNPERPRVFLLDAAGLAQTRRALGQGSEPLEPADHRLLQEAGAALESEGLRGVQDFAEACGTVQTLALAYYFSDHEPFAEGAAFLLRLGFLDEGAGFQAVPAEAGEVGQRLPLSWLVDAVGLIGASPAWSCDDQQGLAEWADRYLDWLLHSAPGQEAGRAGDHLGTWVELQAAALALFTGQGEAARQVLGRRVPAHLEAQLDEEGRQPRELDHPDSLSCCLANLVGFFDLADLGRHVGVDLWGWQGTGGRSLQRAFTWLIAQGLARAWPHPQEGYFEVSWWVPLLRRGARRWADQGAEARLRALPGVDWAGDRTNLLYPPTA